MILIIIVLLLYTHWHHTDCRRPSLAKKRCIIVSLIVVALVTFTVLIISIIAPVAVSSVCNTTQAPTLGHEGDTILVSDSVTGFCHSKITASQCLSKEDSFHNVQVYLVKNDNLTIREKIDNFQSVRIDQADSSHETGIVNFLYLFIDGVIKYTLCIGSEGKQQLEGKLFIFDDYEKFSNYQGSPELGESLSVFEQEIEIGKNRNSICTTVQYTAHQTSYYFIASRTPGGIFYTFNYMNHIRYFNQSDYSIQCTIDSMAKSCGIPVSGGTAILATILQSERTSYLQTHLCLTPNELGSVTRLYGFCGFLAVVMSISTFLILIRWLLYRYKLTDTTPLSESEQQPLIRPNH